MKTGLPAGWVAFNGTVEPSETVAGYAARHQTVWGKCQFAGCDRRLKLEPEMLVKDGVGALLMGQIKTWARCQRPGGCSLTFHNEAPLYPLKLEHFTGLAHVRIRVRCRGHGCKFSRTWPVEVMIKGLQERGQGDERTEIDKLGAKMTSACPLCKKSNWVADVLCADTDTRGWKSNAESYFDRFEIVR